MQRLTAQANQDPLLKPWTGPHSGVPPWDQARAELVAPALELGIQLQEAEAQVIANNPEHPTFDNTIGAMQNSGRHLDRATTIFGVMTDNISNEQIQGVEAEWSPRITAAYNAITFNRALFNRIHDLYERCASLGLDAQQMRLLERTHDQFVRAGAAATPEQQARLGAINEDEPSKVEVSISLKLFQSTKRLTSTALIITPRIASIACLTQKVHNQVETE